MTRKLPLRNDIGRFGHVLGLSDGAIAEAAGISRAHLNRIKNGAVVPRVDTAMAIARALGVPVRAVFHLRHHCDAR
jgi:DNA-binding XRE family transcriptional regulator